MKINELKVSDLLVETRKVNAKPGGGAIVILTANLAVNLILMMDRKNWGDLSAKADENRKLIKEISDILTKCADEDVYYADLLIEKYKNKEKIKEKDLVDASKPQIKLNTLALKALEVLAFYLDHGKRTTLTDGEIANEMLLSVVKSSVLTIKANLNGVNYKYNIDEVLKDAQKLYQHNRDIIERRKAWQEFM